MNRDARIVKLGWEGDDGESFIVRAEVRFGTPSPGPFTSKGERTTWVPSDGDDVVEVVSVTEDKPGGLAREDLVDVVQEQIASGAADALRVEALERAADRSEP